MEPVHMGAERKSAYSNIDVVIMANRSQFPMAAFDNAPAFGLMTIANDPILAHLLNRLHSFYFPNLFLVCYEKDELIYKNFLFQDPTNKVTIVKDDGNMTTCDILRSLKSTNHIMLLPIDLLTSVDLTKFFDFHVSAFSSLTMFVTSHDLTENERGLAPGIAAANTAASPKYYFVTDDKHPEILLHLLADEDAIKGDMDITIAQANQDNVFEISENMEIPAHIIQKHRSMTIDCSRRLTKAYLLSPECAAFLYENDNINSIESELVSQLSSRNMKVTLFNDDPRDVTMTISDFAALFQSNLRCASRDLACFTPVFPFVPQQSETVGYFAGSNLSVSPNFKFNAFCVYGNGLSVSQDPVMITRSVIGSHCKLGKNVRIINSVIFDHVIIEDNVSIKNCIIGSDSTIRAGSDLKKTVVCPRYTNDQPLNSDQNIVKRREF